MDLTTEELAVLELVKGEGEPQHGVTGKSSPPGCERERMNQICTLRRNTRGDEIFVGKRKTIHIDEISHMVERVMGDLHKP